jgi:hypothetical protein
VSKQPNMDEQLVEQIHQSRMIDLSSQVIFPLLEKKIEDRLKQACVQFTMGQKDFLADIAYIHALRSLMSELKSKQKQGDQAFLKLDQSTKE